MLLKDLWGEKAEVKKPEVNVIIPENVAPVLEDRMILVSDITGVIAYAESTGNRLKNTENGHYIAYLQPRNVTYWVEYSPQGEGFIVHNAYCHRIVING